MNYRRLPLLGFAAALITSAAFAACTQDFDAFEPVASTSGQGGSTSSASSASSGTLSGGNGGATGTGGTSSSSASASGGASSSSSATSAGGASSAQSSSATGPMPGCGDGMQDPGEDCDDGNVTPADGCSATCTVEDPDTCSGAPAVPLAPGMPLMIQGDTTGVGNDTGATPCGGSQSGDLVYAVTPSQDGTLTATVQGNFATLVYARDACPGMNGQNLECSQGNMPATISFMVQAGQVVYVIVDGYGGAPEEGPFTLTLDLQ